jgi:hypothetical protein
MPTRNPDEYLRLLKEQYELLKDAVDGYYAGSEAKANDVAIRIRTLVHDTSSSHALLSLLDADYLELDIYHKPTTPNQVFSLKQGIRMSGDGKSEIIRTDFSSPDYTLVPLKRWWTEEYLVMWKIRSSKKQVVLAVCNKDGGAHVDPEVPASHAAASKPPFAFGVNNNFVQPNLARSTVAQAGNELLNYIERHFSNVLT